MIPHLSRRALLQSLAISGAAVAIAPTLTSCSGNKGSGGTAPGKKSNDAFPAYQQITSIPKPDLPGNPQGVQDVYFKYPMESSFKSVEGEVGSGSTIRAFTLTYQQPPTPKDRNKYWQMINKELNIDYLPQIVPADNFYTKFATTMAGGDLPEVMQVPVWMGLKKLPQMARSIWTDLGEYLSGDNVKKYPNIANIPTYAWTTCRIEGRLVGVPTQRAPFGNVMFQRRDIIEKMGLDPNPTSKDDFIKLCKALSNPAKNQYALCGAGTPNGVSWMDNIIQPMFGVPNQFSIEDGKLKPYYMAEGFLESADFVKQLWEAKFIHPDTPSVGMSQASNYFFAGNVIMREDGMQWWQNQTTHQDIHISAMEPFSANGGKPINYQGAGSFSLTAIKKGLPKEKVEEILRVMNWCAAPFGSEEYFKQWFGVEGETYSLTKDGQPELKKSARADMAICLDRICSAPQVRFSPIRIDQAFKEMHALQTKLVEYLTPNPTLGLYSETAAKSSSLSKAISDAYTGYILGRNDKKRLQDAIATYDKQAGQQIVKEYEEQLSKQ